MVQYNPSLSTTLDMKHVEYTSFGAPTGGTCILSAFSFGLGGMPYFAAVQEYATMAPLRPLTGTFDSPDPSGFASGTTNLYVYCGDSPVDNVDPSGECDSASTGYSAGSAFGGASSNLPVGSSRWLSAAFDTLPGQSKYLPWADTSDSSSLTRTLKAAAGAWSRCSTAGAWFSATRQVETVPAECRAVWTP